MLKRINRIFSRKEFGEIKLKGWLCRAELISGLVLKKEDKNKRFGIIVSKKISKKAVDRNKIRRLVYLAIGENLEKFSEGVRIIFLVRPEIINKKYEEISAEMLDLVQKYLSKGYNCRFIPNCSEYTYEAVEKYGVAVGLWIGFKRLLRCNPWSKGGIDLLK